MIVRALGLWVLLLLLAPPAWAQQTVRIGIFVGNNVGLGEDAPLRSAEQEARDLAAAFQKYGGLARERAYVLAGQDAGQLDRTLHRVDGQVREAQARGSRVLLFFYYSGHATRTGLHLAGTTMPMSRIRRWLEQQPADVRVAFVDACESGTLARVRGGIPVDTIDLSVADTLSTKGLAIITSSGPLSVARESEQYGGGVFSQALLTGLRGGADTDQDGSVTLEEAYEFAFSETVRDTARAGQGVQRPEFRRALTGVGDVVLTRLADRSAGLVFPAELEGTYTVVSVSTGQVIARLDKRPGKHQRLALPSGRYIVRKVRQADVLVAELDLAWGGEKWVEDSRMTLLPLGDPLARSGAPFDRPHAIFLAVQAGTPILPANGRTGGMELGSRIKLSGALGLQLGLSADVSTTRRGYLRSRLTASRASIGLSAVSHHRRVDVLVGGGILALRLHQAVYFELYDEREQAEIGAQTTLGPLGHADLHLPFGRTVGLMLGAHVHAFPVLIEDDLRFRASARARGALVFRIGGRRRGTLRSEE